ncbi:uncharacterized protein LOC135104371 [Scylla paramamosain]|uniref:uncharacterized protein LOC135104371 n=1 Tax=Scylla paramamosain TaxID=85552 RepID=UPI003083083F
MGFSNSVRSKYGTADEDWICVKIQCQGGWQAAGWLATVYSSALVNLAPHALLNSVSVFPAASPCIEHRQAPPEKHEYVGAVNLQGDTAPHTGFFHFFRSREVVVRRYNPAAKDLKMEAAVKPLGVCCKEAATPWSPSTQVTGHHQGKGSHRW